MLLRNKFDHTDTLDLNQKRSLKMKGYENIKLGTKQRSCFCKYACRSNCHFKNTIFFFFFLSDALHITFVTTAVFVDDRDGIPK